VDNPTALILMDFAENYSFHIQDETQGYHWTHQSCTVHPVVCYYKNSEKNNCWFAARSSTSIPNFIKIWEGGLHFWNLLDQLMWNGPFGNINYAKIFPFLKYQLSVLTTKESILHFYQVNAQT